MFFLTQRDAEGSAEVRRGGLEVIDDSFDAVFEMDDVEVD